MSEEDFIAFMSKCGLIMKDVQTGKYKIKLYEENGCLKGDALCTYIKVSKRIYETIILKMKAKL
jgi:HIV Tat-specific factor 1